jgi:mRNA-degrading endonuclease HigB of HigAB toxin-antitoxin module
MGQFNDPFEMWCVEPSAIRQGATPTSGVPSMRGLSRLRRQTGLGPADVKARYPTASFLSDNRVIFNIEGNRYRIETKVSYEITVVLVRRVGTHAEYSKWS